VGFIKTQISL